MRPSSEQAQRKQIARTLPHCHYIALGLFLVDLLLWGIEPSPAWYLLAFALVGVIWFGALVWMWRMWSFVAAIAAMVAFALYVVPERLFHASSQVQQGQGVLLAFSVASILLYLFRRAVVRYARLDRDTGPAGNRGPSIRPDSSQTGGGPPSVN
jgi:hypothetical protein